MSDSSATPSNLGRVDTLVRNVTVVRPNVVGTELVDIAITGGKFVAVGSGIGSDGAATEVIDGTGMLAFPGLVDPHFHVGIYNPLEDDAESESKAAAQGGVTTAITYFRTGEYYLNKGGPYSEFYPEVLARSEGHYWVDYAYHLAPINPSHIDEMPALLDEHGVASFKIFMFYGGHGLHGRSDSQGSFLKLNDGESYDVAHFEFIMRQITKMIEERPEIAPYISLGLHCEFADILNAYTAMVDRDGKLTGLRAYSAARPPHSEGLAVFVASYLAHETACPNINLLHLSSRKALEAALMMRDLFPHVDFRREVTIGHLVLDVDSPNGLYAKVNPPIRERADVEFLWEKLLEGDVSWVASDHACCRSEMKWKAENPDDIWMAKSGFGGTEYLLSALHTEGVKRGLSLNRMAELASWNAAQRFGLLSKGDIAVGYDADLALFDPSATFTVRAAESESSQGYTPFEGLELTGRVQRTMLRGQTVWLDGSVVGPPVGRYQHRPTR
jgi:allantoinase